MPMKQLSGQQNEENKRMHHLVYDIVKEKDFQKRIDKNVLIG